MGILFLLIRVVLYAAGGALSWQGLATVDEVSGDITIHVENTTQFLGGQAMLWGTFVVSRFATVR